MEIPNTVKILYKEYEIVQEKNIHNDSSDLYGEVHYLDEKILLNVDSKEDQKKATLIHELIHAIDEMYQISLNEDQVDKLGNGVYMMIKENPQMFKGDN